jgi:hypothetical protein
MGVQWVHFRQPQAPCSSSFGVPLREEELSEEKRELSCASPTEEHDRHSCCAGGWVGAGFGVQERVLNSTCGAMPRAGGHLDHRAGGRILVQPPSGSCKSRRKESPCPSGAPLDLLRRDLLRCNRLRAAETTWSLLSAGCVLVASR